MKKYKFTLISLAIIILAAIPLLLLSNTGSKPAHVEKMVSASPTTTPITAENAEPTLTQVDADMQKALNQVDVDLQAVSSVDASKDSTAGL